MDWEIFYLNFHKWNCTLIQVDRFDFLINVENFRTKFIKMDWGLFYLNFHKWNCTFIQVEL